jgi:hypothetical protein
MLHLVGYILECIMNVVIMLFSVFSYLLPSSKAQIYFSVFHSKTLSAFSSLLK